MKWFARKKVSKSDTQFETTEILRRLFFKNGFAPTGCLYDSLAAITPDSYFYF